VPNQRGRSHSGRRRNEEARQAILAAVVTLIQRSGGKGVTVEAAAAEAGVGRQTIYRWWPRRGPLIAEALAERAQVAIEVPETGDFCADLTAFLTAAFVDAQTNAEILRGFMALAQQDPDVAAVAPDFAALRRAPLRTLLDRGRRGGALLPSANLVMLEDLAYGFLWYRLLLGHAPLDAGEADRLADAIIAAGNA
jgi:AcrR family transcriptional regulator